MPAGAPSHGRSAQGPNGTASNGQSQAYSATPENRAPPHHSLSNAKSKKSKSKKAVDPSETGKLLAAKINQLELDAAGEKDQEHEIEREVKRATRDLNNLLANIGTSTEKMDTLQKKYADLYGEMEKLKKDHTRSKKRADGLQKEKDTQRVELNKTNSVKEKLEKLAREFTKDNKKLKARQEDIKRLEESDKRGRDNLSARDLSTLTDQSLSIQRSIQSTQSRKMSPETDELFRQKFKNLVEQHSMRELHYLSALRLKDSEIQHHLARLENQRKAADTESSRARQLTSQVSTFSQTETELRSQLNIYVEKFKQVEDTLNNSNDLFLTFRKEMEDMSKKTKRLEKENLSLTRKHEMTSSNVLAMAEEREKVFKDLEAERKKNTTLESIIRRMQDQGRDPGLAARLVDEDATESDYEDSEEGDYVGSEEVEYDDDETEDDMALHEHHSPPQPPPTFGPVPPPPSLDSTPLIKGPNGVVRYNGERERFGI